MRLMQTLMIFFMVIAGQQGNFIHAAENAMDQLQESHDYSNETKYLGSDTNFDQLYPDDARGFEIFIKKENGNYMPKGSFTDYMNQKIVELHDQDQNSDLHKKSQDDGFDIRNALTFANFSRAHLTIHDEIKSAQLAWLVDALQLDKNSADFKNDTQFRFLKASPSTHIILDSPELPLLASLENNNDLIVSLLLIHHPNFNAIDWNERLPDLAQGCELLLHQNAGYLIHAAVGSIDQSQLPENAYYTAVFKPLQVTVMSIETQIVQALHNSIKKINSAIDDAIRDNSAINPHVMPALSYLMQHEQVPFIHKVFEYYVWRIQKRFIDAICGNKINAVVSFVQTQMNLNFKENHSDVPLTLAAYKNNFEIVRLLLAAGADVNMQDSDDNSSLFWAVFNNNLEMVCLLLAGGADVNIKSNNDNAPLYFGVYRNNSGIVRLLLAAGADVNVKDSAGWIPFTLAAYNNNLEIIRLLLAAGADVNMKNDYGKKALDYVFEKLERSDSNEEDRVKAQQIIDLLVDAGVKLAE